MTKTFNWGILSPGRIAHQFAEAVNALSHCEIAAVASSSQSRANNFADKYRIPHAYDDYQQLLKQPDLDAIYVSSVHSMHANQVQACLTAGFPVLCEKPITVNAKELAYLIKLAEAHQVFLMEALWTRFLPVTDKVNKWLADGLIGDLSQINASFGFVSNTPVTDRLKNPALAGGVLLDLGIYPIAMSQFFSNSVVTHFESEATLGDTGIDEELNVNLTYANGVKTTFQCSFRKQFDNTMVLTGTEGKIEISAPFWGANKVRLVTHNNEQEIELPHLANGFEYQIQAAMEAIKSGQLETASMPLNDSLANLQLMDAIRKQIGVHYPFE